MGWLGVCVGKKGAWWEGEVEEGGGGEEQVPCEGVTDLRARAPDDTVGRECVALSFAHLALLAWGMGGCEGALRDVECRADSLSPYFRVCSL